MSNYEEWLFAGTLDDLKEKLASKNTYQTLMTSGLLRKLLLDGDNSLLHRVNRRHRLKIRFRYTPPEAPGPGSRTLLWGAMDGLDPESVQPARPPVEDDRDGFLKLQILQVRDEMFSVAQVIRHAAHVMGGVHVGRGKDSRDRILEKLVPLNLGGAPVLVRSLISVGHITHRALLPIRRRLVELDRGEPTAQRGRPE